MSDPLNIKDHLDNIQNDIKRLSTAISGDQRMGQPGLVPRVEALERMFEELLRLMKNSDDIAARLAAVEAKVQEYDKFYSILVSLRLNTLRGWVVIFLLGLTIVGVVNRLGGVDAVFDILLGIVGIL
jgi:hypothetical protein